FMRPDRPRPHQDHRVRLGAVVAQLLVDPLTEGCRVDPQGAGGGAGSHPITRQVTSMVRPEWPAAKLRRSVTTFSMSAALTRRLPWSRSATGTDGGGGGGADVAVARRISSSASFRACWRARGR